MKEIVIRMSEQEYAYMIHKSHIMGDEELYTRHGILTRAFERRMELPKGHKELIDTKELIQDFVKAKENMKDNGVTPVFDVHEITNMILSQEVIIEADEEGNQ